METLTKILIIIWCYTYAIFRGRAIHRPKNIQRVIILIAGKLGDVVCTTPVLSAVRQRYPTAEIFILDDEKGITQQVLADSNLANHYINRQSFWKMWQQIRRAHISAACLTGPGFYELALFYLAGIPLIVAPVIVGGECPTETKAYRLIRRLVATEVYRFGHYAPQERLNLLRPLDIISTDTTKHLGFSRAAEAVVKAKLVDMDIEAEKDFLVLLSVSSGNKIKNWGIEKFSQVIGHILKTTNAKIILVGTKTDHQEISDLLKLVTPEPRLIDGSGRFDIDEMKALFSQADMFIGVDTGPIYVAEAFGLATIDIIGPMDEREQPPIGPKHRIVVAERRAPELHIMNARVYNEKEARRQTEAISARQVVAEFDSLYSTLINDR